MFNGTNFNRQWPMDNRWCDVRIKMESIGQTTRRNPGNAEVERVWQLRFRDVEAENIQCKWTKPPLDWVAVNTDGTMGMILNQDGVQL